MTFSWLKDADIQALTQAFSKGGHTLRFVGGCVRDGLLGITSADIDAATNAAPDATMALLEKAGIRAIPTGMAHGTVTAVLASRSIEITSLRRDDRTDGRHAEVTFTDSWEEDAARRDFTMNALYLDMDGEVYDYFGGMDDAREGHVKFIGDAGERIREDYLRILRFFRFSAHYARQPMDAESYKACATLAPHMARLSGERIHHEMFKLLKAPFSAKILRQMQEASVLLQLSLGGQGISAVERLEAATAATNPLLKLACLTLDKTKLDTLAARWKLSNAEYNTMAQWQRLAMHLHPQTELAQQKHYLRRYGAEAYQNALWLSFAHGHQEWEFYEPLLAVLEWAVPDFPLRGEDLLAQGMSAGKEMGERLRQLEAAWEASDYSLDKDELLRLG